MDDEDRLAELDPSLLTIDLTEFVGFLVTSARGLMDEPAHYGPFRLIDATSRLVAILERRGLSTEFMSSLRGRIEAGKETSMGTTEEFKAFLDELVIRLVEDG
jgi:hypothetical protein